MPDFPFDEQYDAADKNESGLAAVLHVDANVNELEIDKSLPDTEFKI